MAETKSPGPAFTTVHGLVIPKEWDEEGRPSILSIATFTEQEYEIEKEVGGRLLGFLGKEVILRGVVEKTGKKKFLRNCSILKIKGPSVPSFG